MKIFVVRINPDNSVIKFDTNGNPVGFSECYKHGEVGDVRSYSVLEKKTLTTQNGFHECQNFLAVDGEIRGYLPPGGLRGVKKGERFSVIFITNKGNGFILRGGKETEIHVKNHDKRIFSNKVVGIQVDCKYLGEDGNLKYEPAQWGGEYPLSYQYICRAENSFLFEKFLDDAVELLLGPYLDKCWGSALGASQEILIDNVYYRQFLDSYGSVIDKKILDYLNNELGQECAPTEVDLIDYSANKVANEGRRFLSIHKRIERNQAVVKSAKNLYRNACGGEAPCELCRFNFRNHYKMLNDEFYIEAHHIKPLAYNETESIVTDAKMDFAFLCANCHRMVHRHLAKLSEKERKLETLLPKKKMLKSYKEILFKKK